TDTLAQVNKLDDPDHLRVGAVLTVPSAAPASAPQPAAAPSPPARSAAVSAAVGPGSRGLLVSYTVQTGETLNQIARQFGVRPDAVAQASGLDDPNKLSAGGVLKVPVPAKEHVVVAGETLRDIASGEKV